jgi:YggT family protein
MNPFVQLLSNVIYIYSLILIVTIILSVLISFDIVNRHQPFIMRLDYALNRLTEPALRPIRQFMPDLGGLDLSPLILLLLLNFLENALLYYL